MPAHRYADENSSAAMLVAKRLAGVAPEVNLWEHVTFETQSRRYQKSKDTGLSVVPQKKDSCSPKFFLKRHKSFI